MRDKRSRILLFALNGLTKFPPNLKKVRERVQDTHVLHQFERRFHTSILALIPA